MTDPDVYVRMATVGPLTASTEPVAVPATRALLTDPSLADLVFGGIWRCNEGVWEAWQERRHPLLLAALAKCGDNASDRTDGRGAPRSGPSRR